LRPKPSCAVSCLRKYFIQSPFWVYSVEKLLKISST